MNAAQHLEAAEELLASARASTGPGMTGLALSLAVQAQSHATMALAIESGAPHATPTGEASKDAG